MFLEAALGSLVMAAVVIGWFLIQRWASSVTYPEECNLPRSECHHCLSRGACALRSPDEPEGR
ncbi:MAG TPA: hypothetical protein PLD73_10615 [Candidatus Hydrogenedentes bacterium]|nr:hypothetical protein [Candidatus Hydrogenedentota bacterium]